MQGFVKQRDPAEPGSIPDVLGMFGAEVRFYQEIAPHIGIRVPDCYRAEIRPDGGTIIVLEDLSAWTLGADPIAAVHVLAELHREFADGKTSRWPWLRATGAASDLVEKMFDDLWPTITMRKDLSAAACDLGARLVGYAQTAERLADTVGAPTLIHGDASNQNLRTSPDGEVALLDWEDATVAPGICDVAWLLISSVEPERWDEALDAYGTAAGFAEVIPVVAIQGLFSFSDFPEGSAESLGWNRRLTAAADRLNG